eukprot:1160514-Pelagomonas_calceolata.AAC.9
MSSPAFLARLLSFKYLSQNSRSSSNQSINYDSARSRPFTFPQPSYLQLSFGWIPHPEKGRLSG